MDHQETIWMKEEEAGVLPDEPGLVCLQDPLKTEVPGHPIKPNPELKWCMDSSETNVIRILLDDIYKREVMSRDMYRRLLAVPTEKFFFQSASDPLGISLTNNFIKEDPGLCFEADETFVSDPLGFSWTNNFIKEDPGCSLEADETANIVLAPKRCATNITRWSQNSGEKCGISREETLTLGVVPSELEMSAQESTHSMTFDTDTQRAVVVEEEEEEEEEEQQQQSLLVTRLKCSRRENEFHKFTCNFCLQSFASKYRLTMHVFIHMDGLEPPTYVCKTCGEVFLSDVSLTEHMKVSEGDQSASAAHIDQFDCIAKHVFFEGDRELSVVKLAEQQSSEIESRAFPTLGTRSLKCYVCGMSFSHTWKLKRHLLKHNGKQPHKCNVCGKSFTRSDCLKKHALTHTGHRPHKCNVCGKSFTQSSSLKNHALTHTGQRPHKCNVCGKSFTQSSNLNNHALTHTGQRPHKCNVCGKSFTLLGSLKNHALTHTGQRPHKCNVCGKSFSKSSNLNNHALTHTGQRPHKCNVCGKSFTQLSNLKKHALTHTGQRPHKCNVCGKSFTLLGYLKEHALTHTGQRPHKCNVCGKSFTKSRSLKNHALTHTGQSPTNAMFVEVIY